MPLFRKRRRFMRRRFRKRPSRFSRAVKKVILRNAEPKSIIINTGDGTSLVEGDGVTRVIQVQNIPSNLTQGVKENQFIGDKVFLKGVSIRGQISVLTQTGGFPAFIVRWTLVKSRSNAGNMLGSGATYGNTTTAVLAPVQTPPAGNPVFFRGSGNIQFTGDGFVEPFDPTNVRVIGSFTKRINVGGANQSVFNFKHMFRINKMFQYLDPTDGSDLSSAPNFGKYGSYYLIRQVVALANSNSTTPVGTMDIQVQLYFRDP